MGLKNRMVHGATRLGTSAAEAAVNRAQQVGSGLHGLHTLLTDEEQPTNIEAFLMALIKAVRDDEPRQGRKRRDVYEDARSRRRRLGLVSFGAGPLVGVATHLVDLYCEVATFCDLVDIHELDLAEREIAAHMLVMWAIVEPLDEAKAVMAGVGERTVATIMADTLRDGAASHLPASPTKRAVIKALWEARALLNDARNAAGAGSVGGLVFAGHHTKQFIKKAEDQLRFPSTHSSKGIDGHDTHHDVPAGPLTQPDAQTVEGKGMGLFGTPAVKDLKKEATFIGGMYGQVFLGHIRSSDLAEFVTAESEREKLRNLFAAASADVGDRKALKIALKAANIGADSYARLGQGPFRDVIREAESTVRNMLELEPDR
jgi:hypothetical protein